MKLNRYIDHTLLSPFATHNEIEKLCQEAVDHKFYSVCVSPYFAIVAKNILIDSSVKVAVVIGFPYGYNSISSKKKNIISVSPYVDEVDVVINLQAVIAEDWHYLKKEINELTAEAHENNLVIKWIVESGNISLEQLKQLCEMCNEARVDFMKTSTGMLGTGATLEAIQTMREELDEGIQIKASGGIRDRETAIKFINAGATRIGASRSVAIVSE